MARDVRSDPGYFNKPIQFQSEQTTPDGSGGSTTTGWTTVYQCFAHIDTLTDSASAVRRTATRPFLYMQLYPEMDALMTIRYQASTALTPAMTILYRNRRYQIIDVIVPHEELVKIVIPVVLYQAPGTPG
jgi:SPP1 family predicted phage head-tail adaptor